jgi:hypothetical protein
MQIVVAGVDLVGALAGEHYLDVLRGQFRQEVVGDGRADKRGIEGFQVIDHLWQRGQHVGLGVDAFMVLRAED